MNFYQPIFSENRIIQSCLYKLVKKTCNFSLKHYEQCIKKALNKGYTFLKFNEYNKLKNHEKIIFLRHDIDIHVDNALKIALIENKYKVRSTFFVRVLGKYNAWNINVFDKLRKILDLEHEIGLHYELDFSIINKRNLLDDLSFHKLMLEKLLKINIKSLCPHEPVNTNTLHLDPQIRKKLGQIIHAYDNTFFKECKYISDSGGRWREGCMHEFIEKGYKKLCILTHPIWWFKRSPIENY